MKSLKDIFWKNKDLQDITLENFWVESATIWDNLEEKYSDISPHLDNKNIDLSKQRSIYILEKKKSSFDALDIHAKKKKDIKILRKRKNFGFPLFLYISRYLQSIKNYSPTLIFSFIFIFVILFWFFSKFIIENRVNSWYQKLLMVKNGSLPLEEIQKNINDARFSFLIADVLFTPFQMIPWEKITTTKHAIKWWKYISKWLDQSLNLYSKVSDYVSEKKLSDIYFTQLFLNIYNDIWEIKNSLELSRNSYQKISWLPNDDLYSSKNQAIKSLNGFLFYLNTFQSWFREFVDILWHDGRKRYLIVFQNADEIRPTWWFMGSMWLVDIFKWQIRLFQKKDVYAIEWDLKSAEYERLDAPKWIDELTDTFWLRDANYFVNVKDSSSAIKFFTDQAWLYIDGIIYVNQNILLNLLKITWPVYLQWADSYISHENFSRLMSVLVESKVSKEWTLWTPKQVLFDFIEVFISKLIDDGKYFDYIQAVIHDTQSRDIMMWSFDKRENQFLTELWVNGDITYDSSLDFIYPVYTSLSWNKSDRYVTRSYQQVVSKIERSCDFEVTTTIESSHNMTRWEKNKIIQMMDEFNISSESLLEIQWASRNRQYVRVLLPDDAVIIPENNYELVDYWARKGIEFFLDTQQQQVSLFSFSYILANPDCNEYDFKFYKQPWIQNYDVEIDVFGEKFNYTDLQEDFYFKKR